MVYTADSLALAVLEILVHLPHRELLKSKFQRIPVRFDSRLATSFNLIDLPDDWDILPPPDSTQTIGTEWALKKNLSYLRSPAPSSEKNSTTCPGWMSAPRRVFMGLISQRRALLPISIPAGLKSKFRIFEFPNSSVFIFHLLTRLDCKFIVLSCSENPRLFQVPYAIPL